MLILEAWLLPLAVLLTPLLTFPEALPEEPLYSSSPAMCAAALVEPVLLVGALAPVLSGERYLNESPSRPR